MKKDIKIFSLALGLCGGICTTSCDFLDIVPDDTVTEDSKWVDRNTAERTLATVYKSLPPLGDHNSNPGFCGAGEIVLPNLTQFANQNSMRFFLRNNGPAVNPMNFWEGEWGGYSGIRQCNDFIEGIDRVSNMEQQEKERMKAEVKIIKAYEHFYMLRQYGPICPIRVNSSVTESTAGNKVYRESVDDTFRYILELIDEALDSGALPEIITNRASEMGRFTVAAAKFLKARVWLYWASPLFNGNTDYAYFLDHEGRPFFNQTEDASRWQQAAEACEDAIQACRESGIGLYKESDFSTRANLCDQTMKVNALRGAVTEKWNKEIVWGCTSNPVGGSLQGNCMARFELGSGNWLFESAFGVPFATVNLFYTRHGLPVEQDAEYYADGLYAVYRYDKDDEDFNAHYDYDYNKHYVVLEAYNPGMNFDREPRFYATLGFNRGVWWGNFYNDPTDDKDRDITPGTYAHPQNYYGERSSVMNDIYYTPTGYWPKKLVAFDVSQSSAENMAWGTGYPYPDMRYADLLLMAAEAWNETEGPSARVYGYLDEVRERAGLEGIVETYARYAQPAYRNYPASKERLREIIRRERSIELACEGKIYWDHCRWKTAETTFNRVLQGWNVLGHSDRETDADKAYEYYVPTIVYMQNFTHRDYFSPIPDSEMQKNPNLVQNPGW